MGGIAGCTFGLTTGITATGQTEANAKCSDPACRLALSWSEILALAKQGKVVTLPCTRFATPYSSQVQFLLLYYSPA